MENIEYLGSTKQESPESLPSLIKYISSNEVAGFDRVTEYNDMTNLYQAQDFLFLIPSANGTGAVAVESQSDESQPTNSDKGKHSISISMPASPMGEHSQNTETVLFSDNDQKIAGNGFPNCSSSLSVPRAKKAEKAKFLSQPMPKGSAYMDAVNSEKLPNNCQLPLKNPTMNRLKDDRRFDSFKTWSGKLERQLTILRGKPPRPGDGAEDNVVQNAENLTVDRYFDALTGPELDTLRSSEEIVLPDDKQWPFLLRYPISSFGICLGTSSQAILWKTLATSTSTKFLHVSLTVNIVLWTIAVSLMAIVSSIYLLKVIFYFEAVRREYYHPVRVNFFFAPWIALLFLALGAPPLIANKLHESLWYILMTPIFCLELKIYGQWMSGGQRRLSKVANPSNHLSVVGNFVGALLGATMGLKEGPIFFFAVGLAHYTVLFVTLYQRLPTNETLPKELHPVFFLFVAAPSVASMAWAKIQGSFVCGSRIAYFIALFLYLSLAVRVNFFRGFKFSLAWWAYTFPMTGAAIATLRYSNEVTSVVTQAMSVILSSISTLTVMALLVTTVLHAFVLRDLFPNDIAIAISERKPKISRNWFHLKHGSPDSKDIENYLKFTCSGGKDSPESNSKSSSLRHVRNII